MILTKNAIQEQEITFMADGELLLRTLKEFAQCICSL